MKGLTAKERARRSVIISELAELSRGGWYPLRSSDYAGLEAELRALDEKREAAIERERNKLPAVDGRHRDAALKSIVEHGPELTAAQKRILGAAFMRAQRARRPR